MSQPPTTLSLSPSTHSKYQQWELGTRLPRGWVKRIRAYHLLCRELHYACHLICHGVAHRIGKKIGVGNAMRLVQVCGLPILLILRTSVVVLSWERLV